MAAAQRLPRFWEWGRNIVCMRRNYAEHAKELGSTSPAEPVIFLKLSTAYAPEGSPILLPPQGRCLHHEVELAVVLGRHTRAMSKAQAMDPVAGYALCLDMTTRDVQDECKKKGLPWTLAKGFATSCPVSRFVPKKEVLDPHVLKLWLKVNDQLRQEGHTSSMIFSIPYLISSVSRIMTLEEGDIILTRTPKGVGPVEENDEMEAGIEGIVSIRFKVERPKLDPEELTPSSMRLAAG
ncbi:oxaloacetate tautomerase FAHD1, mitochondrial-like [Macrotis lagotis]|uniref:oxaloacetate tautomerase FAHD1, mitochondrial-like n=1 Tax=Macrotis lagotis TaxID=92651 RepID=UPI003D6891C4